MLDAVDRYGPHWPAELSEYSLEAVSAAVGREISAGNLIDGATLSRQGSVALAGLRRELVDISASVRGPNPGQLVT